MQTIFQTIFKSDGNCFQACIASILELPLDEVPHFFKGLKNGDFWTKELWDSFRSFMKSKGYEATWIDPEEEPQYKQQLEESGEYYIGFGMKHGLYHCIVMQNGQFIHDPAMNGFIDGQPYLLIYFSKTAINIL